MDEFLLTANVLTWVSAFLTLVLGLAAKEFVVTFTSGFLFFLNRQFNEGDRIIIDGHKGIIVKIGIRQTVFGLEEKDGYIWRFVYNDRIKYLRLEKIILDSKISDGIIDAKT